MSISFGGVSKLIKKFFNGLKMIYCAVPKKWRPVSVIIAMFLLLKYKKNIIKFLGTMKNSIFKGSTGLLGKAFGYKIYDESKWNEYIQKTKDWKEKVKREAREIAKEEVKGNKKI